MLWDPFALLTDKFREMYQSMVELFEWLILDPPTLGQNPITTFLYGNAMGAAPLLAVVVLSFTMVMAIFWSKRRAAFARAALVFVAVIVLTPLWYELIAAFEQMGDDLSGAMMGMFDQFATDTSGKRVLLPIIAITDVVLAGVTLAFAAALVTILMAIFTGYEFITVAFGFLGLLSFALLALGPRARKIFNFLVSMGIVSMVLGRPTAMFFIDLGQWYASTLANTPMAAFITGLVTVASLFIAIAAQFALLILTYVSVSRVAGLVDARITGTVKAISDNRTKSLHRTEVDVNRSALNGRKQAIERSAGREFVGSVAQAGVTAGAAKGAAALVARAAASSTPVSAAVVTGASVVVSKVPKLTEKITGGKKGG